jgi:hypothetical protein
LEANAREEPSTRSTRHDGEGRSLNRFTLVVLIAYVAFIVALLVVA